MEEEDFRTEPENPDRPDRTGRKGKDLRVGTLEGKWTCGPQTVKQRSDPGSEMD